MKATKKPVTIECFKYDGDLMNSNGEYYVPDWAAKAYEDGTILFKDQGEMYIKTLEGDHHASVGDYIIRGVNGELYPCKPDIFEKTYDIDEKTDSVMEAPETTHGFDWAIQQIKAGRKVQRKGWNGKGMFITLQQGSTVDGELMRNAPAKEFYTGKKCNIAPHIDMKAADDTYVVGWLASQTDMLADDWQIAE
ncbi:DUF2829 domain-containing protein [Fibrobacter succinogenes]|uniref:DUF2829 domain-containing protein n=1 Tax=Fibrobacter succinogenes TaxID=833 RepID=UPI0026F1DFB5|nr:DUF2829 domain-containing protein [Fibrobacter succinogenes]